MKRLILLLIWPLLPISVDAGVRFETYNANLGGWDVDSMYWDAISDSTAISPAYLATGEFLTWSVADPSPTKHDSLREYIVGLDTMIILHRIERDTTWYKIWWSETKDTTFVKMKDIECDTIFRVEYRDVWAPKVQVWLDSLLWQKLMKLLEGDDQ